MEHEEKTGQMPDQFALEDWTAEWAEYIGEDAGFHHCSKCGMQAFNYEDGFECVVEVLSDFCPSCGRGMTPKALGILRARFGGQD